MASQPLHYSIGNSTAHGYLAHDESFVGARPGVVVFHAWKGQSEFERTFADELSRHGYCVLAADNYGAGTLASNADEARALMSPLAANRMVLRGRLDAAIDALKQRADVDSTRVAVLGFCFGGMCALEAARANASIRGAVSLHGLLNKGAAPTADKIAAKVLVLHGFDDPMAKPDAVIALGQELTQAQADWQVHMYGSVMHAFTNPLAADPGFGTVYDRNADRRARQATLNFLGEVLS